MTLEAVVEFLHDGLTQHTFAFTVDEYYFLTDMLHVLLHHFGEAVNLQIEYVGRREARSGVEQFGCVEVDNNHLA